MGTGVQATSAGLGIQNLLGVAGIVLGGLGVILGGLALTRKSAH
jgi:hypothetical protein